MESQPGKKSGRAAKPIAGEKENDLKQIGKIREKQRGSWYKALVYKPISKEDE